MGKIAIVLAVATVIALLYFSQERHTPLTVSGFIEADEIRLGSRVGGRVASVAAREGLLVQKGDVLVELEPFDILEARARAEAGVAVSRAERDKLASGFRPQEIAQARARRGQIEARLAKLVNGPRKQEIATARALLSLAEAELELTELEHRRTLQLFKDQVKSQEDLDRSTSELKAAQSTVQARKEELALLEEGTRREEIDEAKALLEEADQALKLQVEGYRKEEVAGVEAALAVAEAQLAAIARQVEELKILAPVDGVVEAVELQPGDLVGAGTPALSVMDTSRLWVRAFVPENRLGVGLDEKVTVTADSFPGERFTGRVTFISRQAEFTPANVQTPEERSKQVFRIRVTLEEGLDRLRPGMAADVHFASRTPDEGKGRKGPQ